MAQKILVVDDEQSILTLLQFNLEKNGYECTLAMDGKSAFEKGRSENFDVIILDIMLPEMDGLEVCKNLRQNNVLTPILMLTAKDEEFDKVLGLELGADDYITKPFSPREVVARIRAILRRLQKPLIAEKVEESVNEIVIGDLVIHVDNHEAFQNGNLLNLTPKEFELLLYLANNKGQLLIRDRLLKAIWDYEFVGDTRIVDVHVSHLREKIEANTKKPVYIKTVRGLGYKLEIPSTG